MGERRLDSVPGLLPLYAKAALGGLPGVGRLPLPGIGGRSATLPETTLIVPSTRAEVDRVAAYCKVCGFTLRDLLPPTYPHMLAFPLQMSLIVEEDFPFSSAGLVHIANTIVQRRPIGIGEEIELRVSVGDLRGHPKGSRFSFRSVALIGGEVVWEEESVTLSRGEAAEARAVEGDRDGEGERSAEIDFESLEASAEWRLGGDLGRRYGAVSGDRNPIHLSEWSAKPLGFPRAIAHGMWTKARSLAALESTLGDQLRVDVRFKRPILLPGKVAFASGVAPGGATAFAVRDAARGTPHLEGLLSPL